MILLGTNIHPIYEKLLNEKFGLFEFDNNLFLEIIDLISLSIFLDVHNNTKIINEYDSEIKDIYEGKLYKKYSISFNNKCEWLNNCNIYVQLDDENTLNGIVDSFVLAKDKSIIDNKEYEYRINFNNQIYFPYIIKDNKVDSCNIVLIINPFIINNQNTIYSIIRHELKHVYIMFMSKKTNDEINYDIKHFNNLLLVDISIILKLNPLSHNRINKYITANKIINYLKTNVSYLLNKSEVAARLENIYNDIKKSSDNTDNLLLIDFISKYSPVFNDYYVLYKAIKKLKDIDKNTKYEFGKFYLLNIEKIYKKKFINNNNYIIGFDNLCDFYLKIIEKKIFKNSYLIYLNIKIFNNNLL